MGRKRQSRTGLEQWIARVTEHRCKQLTLGKLEARWTG
jgi:hypothetical protein